MRSLSLRVVPLNLAASQDKWRYWILRPSSITIWQRRSKMTTTEPRIRQHYLQQMLTRIMQEYGLMRQRPPVSPSYLRMATTGDISLIGFDETSGVDCTEDQESTLRPSDSGGILWFPLAHRDWENKIPSNLSMLQFKFHFEKWSTASLRGTLEH